MQRISEPYALFLKVCGTQKPSSAEMSFSRFVKTVSCDDGVLLYHTLSGELLLLSQEEYASCRETDLFDELYAHWFFAPDSLDEYKMACDFRKIAALLSPKKQGITSFTVFPTTDCNARCFYCYELGRPRKFMSDQVAADAADYMDKVRENQPIEICWFGGEPLYNMRAIDVICDRLRQNNVPFTSKMISNGYLFDENTIKKSKTAWNLTAVQIPIDGTEQVYNRTKAFIYMDENAFARVLQNVSVLLNNEIRVVIRLNLNRENEQDLYALVDFLSKRFSGNHKPECYVVLLKDFGHDAKQYENEEEGIFAVDKLNRYVCNLGLSHTQTLKRELYMNKCMADNDHSVTILPEGRLGKCEHESEQKLIGSIYEETLNREMIDYWKERVLIDECKTCLLSPVCINLKHCAWDNGCTAADRKLKTANLDRAISQQYEQWKER